MSKFLPIYCYPAHINVTNIRMPALCRRMQTEGVRLVIMRWDGTIKTLPCEHSVVVRYSSMLDIGNSPKIPDGIKFASRIATINATRNRRRANKATGISLQKFCETFGHIIIYEDRIVRNEEDPWEEKPANNIEDLWTALAPFIQGE